MPTTPEDFALGDRVKVANERGSWVATVVAASKKRLILVDAEGTQRPVQYNSKESLADHEGFVGWYDPAIGLKPQGRVWVEFSGSKEETFLDLLNGILDEIQNTGQALR